MKLSKFGILLLVVPFWLLPLAGCGGSGTNSGAVIDPMASHQQDPGSTPTPDGAGTILTYALSLTTIGSSGATSVGSNSTVIATAVLKDNNGHPVTSQPVKFEEISAAPGDADSVTIPVPIVATSSEGTAITLLKTANTVVNKDVIIKASTTVGDQLVTSVSVFKIVRSAGNYINFITTKIPTDPDGNLNRLEVQIKEIDPLLVPSYNILQLVTIEVLDRNGDNRTQVPVKLSVLHVTGNCTPTIDIQEIITDNTGLGVFSNYVNLSTPPIGSENTCTVIYKATTADPYSDTPTELFSYGAYIVNLKNIKP